MSELLIPTLNFSILVALLGYFTWPIFKKSVKDRSETLKRLVDEARFQKIDAEKKFREVEAKLREFEQGSDQSVSKAVKDAEEMKDRLIVEAKKQAEQIVKDAEGLAAANLNEFKNELRRQTVQLAVEQAEKVIRSKLSQDVQKKIINDYVEKV